MFRCILESEITLIVKVSLKNSIIEWKKKVCKVHSAQHAFFVTLLIITSQPNLPLRGFQQNSARLLPGLLIFLVLEMASVFRQLPSDTVLLESKWRSIKREIQTSPQTIIVNKIQKIDPTLARFNCKCSKVSEEKCFFALKAGLCHKKNTQQNESSFYHKTSCVKAVKTLQPTLQFFTILRNKIRSSHKAHSTFTKTPRNCVYDLHFVSVSFKYIHIP